MALSNPNNLLAGAAARDYFNYYQQSVDKAAEITQIDVEINAYPFTGDQSIKDLESIGTEGTEGRQKLVNELAAIDIKKTQAEAILSQFFLDNTGTEIIYNDDATQAIYFDRATSALSIISYP
jgi:hypothetical protein